MSDDRQPESVTAPQKCAMPLGPKHVCGLPPHGDRVHMAIGERGKVYTWLSPAPAPGAPPEWCMRAAKALWVESGSFMPGDLEQYDLRDEARLIHAAYNASEEARKVERMEKALRALAENMHSLRVKGEFHDSHGFGSFDACNSLYCVHARTALASPLVEETRHQPDCPHEDPLAPCICPEPRR